jgi:hypothetical protein
MNAYCTELNSKRIVHVETRGQEHLLGVPHWVDQSAQCGT